MPKNRVTTRNEKISRSGLYPVEAFQVSFKNQGTAQAKLHIGQRSDYITLDQGQVFGWGTDDVETVDTSSVYIEFGAGTADLQLIRTTKTEG